MVMTVADIARSSSHSWESVKRRRIVDQDMVADGLLRGPRRELVEQQRIVWLVGLVRMRPIRSPKHALGGGFDIGSADPVHVSIAGRAIFAAVVGDRQFHPGAAFVDQAKDVL